ncbi:MAG: bifunctional DNA primase/polymerase [Archaeoglobus sp.]|nr:bifunctional DNA primase/polymerase [Archaeoglobus sp.]
MAGTAKLKLCKEKDNSLLDAALDYVKRGWSLIPLAPRGKKPFKKLLPVVLDENGNRRASWKPFIQRPASENEIKDWFRRYPNINIGIITGQASGLVVLDFDSIKPIGMPVTPAVKTGRGYHFYFSTNQLINTARFNGGEIKAEGSYVVAPGSLHPSGERYSWVEFLSPNDIEPVPFSEEITKHLKLVSVIPVVSKPPPNKDPCYTLNDTPNVSNSKIPYLELQQDEQIAFKIIELMSGQKVRRLKSNIRCPLPGHTDRRPSAGLFRMRKDGVIALKEFHEGEDFWYLPELYASYILNKPTKLAEWDDEGNVVKGHGETVVWWLRCLADLGYIKVPAIMAPELPPNAPESTKKLYEGFTYLLALRSIYNPKQIGAPFSYRFAAGWCGIGSLTTVQKAFNYLREHGYIRRVKNKTRTSKLLIWQLGPGLARQKQQKE